MIENVLSRMDYWVLEKNYRYAQWAKQFEQDPILSRVHALAISPLCAVGLVVKGVADSGKLLSKGIRSLMNRQLETGNIQLAAVYVGEQVRNLAGAIFGSVTGLVSPSTANRLFMPKDDQLLTPVLDEQKAAQLYALTKRLVDFFDRHGFEYRITSGTFLGAIRHEGEIPWDDDVDLLLSPDAIQSFRELVDSGDFTKETGVAISWADETKGWRIYFDDGADCSGILKGTKFPFVDIFSTKWNGDRVVYASDAMRNWAPQEYYTREEWEKSRAFPFGPLTLNGPEDPTPYFERAFGETGMDFAYLLYHHLDFKVKSWPQRVCVANREPVRYDEGLYEQLVNREVEE